MRGARLDRHRRRGVSLIEMVVVIGIASVVLGVAVTSMHLLLRSERHGTQSVWHNGNVLRLSRDLRSDIHHAGEAVDADGAGVVLELPDDRRVTYHIDKFELERIETTGETVVRRDSYFLPPGSTMRFERPGDSKVVRLVIERARLTETASGEAARTMVVESNLGRDNRWKESK